MGLIDLNDDAHVFCGEDGEYQKWNIDPSVTVDAIPVSFIESEIKRMELEIDIAMSEADDETAERWITRKTTLEFTLEKWRAERKYEYVTLHREDIYFIDGDAERAFYESLAERKNNDC